MPEMRRDPITKSWTIIAAERAGRPEIPYLELEVFEEEFDRDENCFFCSGNEHTTPPEVLSYRTDKSLPDSPGWSLRVVPNKFAALNLDNDFHIKQENLLQVYSYAAGTAEVIIESPYHSRNIALLSVDHITNILRSYRDRYLSLSQENSIKYIIAFRNNGQEAGATLAAST